MVDSDELILFFVYLAAAGVGTISPSQGCTAYYTVMSVLLYSVAAPTGIDVAALTIVSLGLETRVLLLKLNSLSPSSRFNYGIQRSTMTVSSPLH